MKKKVKIPTNAELYNKKTLYHYKKDPIWVTLEKEMQEKAAQGIKPYNKKVGDWLKFMGQLIDDYYITEKTNYRRLNKQIGPPWYFEFSRTQREIVHNLKTCIHEDIFENRPARTKVALRDLGITINFPKDMLMTAMELSIEDPGIFIWELYKMYYKVSPTEPQKSYDGNAQLLMSALVFADLEECRKELIKITQKKPVPPPKPPKKPKPYYQPDVKLGEYLQKSYVPCVSSYPDKIPKPKKPMPLIKKIKLRSAESYLKLAKAEDFLELRKERNRQSKPKERICKYKFWEAPGSLRNTDPKMVVVILKMKMFKDRPKATHMKHKPPFDNIQTYIKGVTYSTGRPVYQMETVVTLPTGYIPINGGFVKLNGEYVINILGYYRYPLLNEDKCDSECDCVSQWNSVKEYLKDSKCDCFHSYDLGHEGKPKAKYFFPPKRFDPYRVDEAKVYQLDEWEGFIRTGVKKALDSNVTTPTGSTETILPTELKAKELLALLLADLSHTPLLIPHLPYANLLNNLQELVRQQVKGDIKKRKHKAMLLKSKRKWLNLGHMDFNARAYMIPFTPKELDNLNFSHRPQLQKLSDKMLSNYTTRARKLWIEHTRLFWNTMKNDKYPSSYFLDTFFTYMPVREKDMYVYNPFSPDTTPKYGAKTCRLPNCRLRWPDTI